MWGLHYTETVLLPQAMHFMHSKNLTIKKQRISSEKWKRFTDGQSYSTSQKKQRNNEKSHYQPQSHPRFFFCRVNFNLSLSVADCHNKCSSLHFQMGWDSFSYLIRCLWPPTHGKNSHVTTNFWTAWCDPFEFWWMLCEQFDQIPLLPISTEGTPTKLTSQCKCIAYA